MNRGKDYYSLLHEKEQLLVQLHKVEKEIKSKTSDFLEESGTQPRTADKAPNSANSKTKNEDFGVLITDGDLDDKLTIREFYDLEEESTSAKVFKNIKNSNVGDPNNSLHDVLRAGKPVKSGGEFHFRDKKYELEFIKTPLLINGNTHKVLTLVKDISSQKTSIRATKLLNSVFETTDDFIVVKSLNQKIIAANEAFVKAMGKKTLKK